MVDDQPWTNDAASETLGAFFGDGDNAVEGASDTAWRSAVSGVPCPPLQHSAAPRGGQRPSTSVSVDVSLYHGGRSAAGRGSDW